MKLIRNLFSGGVLVLLCCAASMAQSVQTDYDRFTVRALVHTLDKRQQRPASRLRLRDRGQIQRNAFRRVGESLAISIDYLLPVSRGC